MGQDVELLITHHTCCCVHAPSSTSASSSGSCPTSSYSRSSCVPDPPRLEDKMFIHVSAHPHPMFVAPLFEERWSLHAILFHRLRQSAVSSLSALMLLSRFSSRCCSRAISSFLHLLGFIIRGTSRGATRKLWPGHVSCSSPLLSWFPLQLSCRCSLRSLLSPKYRRHALVAAIVLSSSPPKTFEAFSACVPMNGLASFTPKAVFEHAKQPSAIPQRSMCAVVMWRCRGVTASLLSATGLSRTGANPAPTLASAAAAASLRRGLTSHGRPLQALRNS